METAKGPLVDLSTGQHAQFLEEVDQRLLQVAGSANQFHLFGENVSYKHTLAHSILIKIENSEWHINRLAIVNIVAYPLRQMIPMKPFLKADDLERVEARYAKKKESQKAVPETMQRHDVSTAEQFREWQKARRK